MFYLSTYLSIISLPTQLHAKSDIVISFKEGPRIEEGERTEFYFICMI